jgi:hypothetical protein
MKTVKRARENNQRLGVRLIIYVSTSNVVETPVKREG